MTEIERAALYLLLEVVKTFPPAGSPYAPRFEAVIKALQEEEHERFRRQFNGG